MYNIIYETSRQSRFDAQYWMLGAGALGRPRGMVWGGRREEGSGWGTHVYLWWIHVDIWQNQYNIVKLNNKIKFKKNPKNKEDFKAELIEYLQSHDKNCCGSATQSCLTLCYPMNCTMPSFPVLHYLPEFARTHVH